jgi:hypothetical protein
MDREIRAVFIGAAVSMVLSTVALRNHPTECYVKMQSGKVTHILIGHNYESPLVGEPDD